MSSAATCTSDTVTVTAFARSNRSHACSTAATVFVAPMSTNIGAPTRNASSASARGSPWMCRKSSAGERSSNTSTSHTTPSTR
jgi:hypothetical protein